MADPYSPINCEIHDELELLCMRKAEQTITYRDGETTRTARVRFLTIDVKQGEEFLVAEENGAPFVLRLDKLERFTS